MVNVAAALTRKLANLNHAVSRKLTSENSHRYPIINIFNAVGALKKKKICYLPSETYLLNHLNLQRHIFKFHSSTILGFQPFFSIIKTSLYN